MFFAVLMRYPSPTLLVSPNLFVKASSKVVALGYEQSSVPLPYVLGTEDLSFFKRFFWIPEFESHIWDVRLQGGLLACSRLDQKIALNGLMELRVSRSSGRACNRIDAPHVLTHNWSSGSFYNAYRRQAIQYEEEVDPGAVGPACTEQS